MQLCNHCHICTKPWHRSCPNYETKGSKESGGWKTEKGIPYHVNIGMIAIRTVRNYKSLLDDFGKKCNEKPVKAHRILMLKAVGYSTCIRHVNTKIHRCSVINFPSKLPMNRISVKAMTYNCSGSKTTNIPVKDSKANWPSEAKFLCTHINGVELKIGTFTVQKWIRK